MEQIKNLSTEAIEDLLREKGIEARFSIVDEPDKSSMIVTDLTGKVLSTKKLGEESGNGPAD